MVTNGWRRRRAIKGKCPNFLKGRFLPLETSVASSETVIAPFDKKNQFGTLAFSHNSNFKFWLERGTFYAKSGSQGRQRRNSGCFRNVTNIFPLVDLGQNWLNTTCFLQFHCRKRNIPCSINRAPPSHTYNQQKSKHFKRKMRAAISKMITKVRSFVDKAGI